MSVALYEKGLQLANSMLIQCEVVQTPFVASTPADTWRDRRFMGWRMFGRAGGRSLMISTMAGELR